MLQDVPDYAERRRLLEGLKNRLEALLSPKIVAAFNNHSLGNALALIVRLIHHISLNNSCYSNNCFLQVTPVS